MPLHHPGGDRRGGFVWIACLLAVLGAAGAGILQAAQLDLATEAFALATTNKAQVKELKEGLEGLKKEIRALRDDQAGAP